MKILRKVFAPLFWLRDIRDVSEKKYRAQLAMNLMHINKTPLQLRTKKMLIAVMTTSYRCSAEEFEEQFNEAEKLLDTFHDDEFDSAFEQAEKRWKDMRGNKKFAPSKGFMSRLRKK